MCDSTMCAHDKSAILVPEYASSGHSGSSKFKVATQKVKMMIKLGAYIFFQQQLPKLNVLHLCSMYVSLRPRAVFMMGKCCCVAISGTQGCQISCVFVIFKCLSRDSAKVAHDFELMFL